jgi:hypothetical protein
LTNQSWAPSSFLLSSNLSDFLVIYSFWDWSNWKLSDSVMWATRKFISVSFAVGACLFSIGTQFWDRLYMYYYSAWKREHFHPWNFLVISFSFLNWGVPSPQKKNCIWQSEAKYVFAYTGCNGGGCINFDWWWNSSGGTTFLSAVLARNIA